MLRHEIESEMLLTRDRQRKFACVDFGCGNLKAIVNRKTENIRFVFTKIYQIHTALNQTVYELEDAYGEHFIVVFDNDNKMYVSQTFDKLYECLAHFVICEKDEKRYLIELSSKKPKLCLIPSLQAFPASNHSYAIMYNKNGNLCFVDKESMQLIGPREFYGISLLKSNAWIIVTTGAGRKIIVRTIDFAYSESFSEVQGYSYLEDNNTFMSSNYLVICSNIGKQIFCVNTMQPVSVRAYQEIKPVNEEFAKVKVGDEFWTLLNLKNGRLC